TSGALAYPIFLSVVGVSVVSVLIIFFVPKFEDMFARLKERGELPFLTEALLLISHSMSRWLWLIVLVGAFGFVYARNALQTEKGRQWSDRMKLKVPLAGNIFQNLAVARF